MMYILPQDIPCTCEAEWLTITCPQHGSLGELWFRNRDLEVCE